MKTTNNRPKLIASDIGGTLISGEHHVPAYTANVLNALVDKGIPVALITGYNYTTTLNITRNLGDGVMRLPQNGSLCLKENQLIWEYRVPSQSAKEMYDYLQQNQLPVIVYKGREEGFNNYYIYEEEMPAISYAFQRLPELTDFENIIGVSTLLPDEQALQVKTKIEEIVGDSFKVIYVRERKGSWLEVLRKDLALKRLCKELDIPPAETVYFGDNFNDREVLRAVGHPVLVENAVPEMKKEFKTIIPSVDQQGVAHYLDQLFNLDLRE